MGKTSFRICLTIIITAALGLYFVSGYFAGKALETTADFVIEMANKNISWEGAGYNGIYGRRETK